jgi:Prophage CP4-57 regulatory protein (AlpA)
MRVLTFADLRAIGIRYSREHPNVLISEQKFPGSFQLSEGGRVVWDEADIDAWLQERRNAAKVNTRVAPQPQYGPRKAKAPPPTRAPRRKLLNTTWA